MTPDRTAAAIEARRRATGQKLKQVRDVRMPDASWRTRGSVAGFSGTMCCR